MQNSNKNITTSAYSTESVEVLKMTKDEFKKFKEYGIFNIKRDTKTEFLFCDDLAEECEYIIINPKFNTYHFSKTLSRNDRANDIIEII